MLLRRFLLLYLISVFPHQNLLPNTQDSPSQAMTTMVIPFYKPETWKLFWIANFIFLPFSLYPQVLLICLQYLPRIFQFFFLSIATTLTTISCQDYHNRLLTMQEFPAFILGLLQSILLQQPRVLKTKSDCVPFMLRKTPSSFIPSSLYALLFY